MKGEIEMTSFKIMKKDFKDALAVSKRTIPKKTGVTRIVGHENELYFFSEGENIKVFDYKPLLGETESFSIEVDPTVIDKWLDKANREMEFQVHTERKTVHKKETITTILHCVEKKQSTEVTLLENPEKQYKDKRNLNYQSFKKPTNMLEMFTEVSKSFQKSDRLFADYAKFTDINMFVFDPLFFLVFHYQENLGILKAHKENGIAIHKDALDVLVKSVKKPKDFCHYFEETKQAFLIKEENTVFWLDYKTDVPFPDYLSLKFEGSSKSVFSIDADVVNEVLKGFPNAKTSKISFETETQNNTNTLVITPDNKDFETHRGVIHSPIERSVFSILALKSFFEGLTGDVDIIKTNFKSKTTKSGYIWFYRNGNKSKMMPGILEAPGFQYTVEELAKLREQLQEEFSDIVVESIDEVELV